MIPVLTQAHWPLIFQQPFHSHNTTIPEAAPSFSLPLLSLQKSKLLQRKKYPLPRDSCPKLAHIRPGRGSRNNPRAGLRLNLKEGHRKGDDERQCVKPHKEKQKSLFAEQAVLFLPLQWCVFVVFSSHNTLFFPLSCPCVYSLVMQQYLLPHLGLN